MACIHWIQLACAGIEVAIRANARDCTGSIQMRVKASTTEAYSLIFSVWRLSAA